MKKKAGEQGHKEENKTPPATTAPSSSEAPKSERAPATGDMTSQSAAEQEQANKIIHFIKEGNSHFLADDFGKALDDFQNCKALATSLTEIKPEDVLWLQSLAFCHEGIGNVSVLLPDLERALEAYNSRKQIFSRLASRDPEDARWQREIAVSQAKLAYVYWKKGRIGVVRAGNTSGFQGC